MIRPRARPAPRRAAPGFTLLEVMVALAVLAMAMMAISDVVGGALRNHVRARQLDAATLLARAKLEQLRSHYREDGFRDFAEEEDGTFEEQGHPEIAWSTEVIPPTVDLGPDGVIKALTGADGGLAGLLGLAGGDAGGAGAPPGSPLGAAGAASAASADGGPLPGGIPAMAGPMMGMLQQQLTALGQQIKGGIRQVRLTVKWKDGRASESFSVVTHLAVLAPLSTQPVAPTGAGALPGAGVLPGQTPTPGMAPGILPGAGGLP